MTKVSRVILFVAALALLGAIPLEAFAVSPEAERRKTAGNEFQKRREYEEARNQYLEALRLEPDYADVHYNLGMLYFYRLKDFNRALYHLNSYRRLETGASDMGQVYSHISQAIEQVEAGERDEYKAAVMDGSLEAFEKFLKKFPVGYYADHAREEVKRILKFQDERTRRENEEKEAYSRALSAGTAEAFDEFLSKYPASSKAQDARTIRMRILERNLQEKLAYQKAANEDTPDGLEEFVRAYPSGPFSEGAKSRAAHLRAAEESFAMAKETGSVTAMSKFLENYSDTPFAKKAREALEQYRKAEVEKAAAEEALRLMSVKKDAEAAAKAKADREAEEAAAMAKAKADADARAKAEAEAKAAAQKAAPVPAAVALPAPKEEAPAQATTEPAPTSNGKASEEIAPKESDAKRRAEQREKARRMMEAEIRRRQQGK